MVKTTIKTQNSIEKQNSKKNTNKDGERSKNNVAQCGQSASEADVLALIT